MPIFEPAEKKIVLRYIEHTKCFIHCTYLYPSQKRIKIYLIFPFKNSYFNFGYIEQPFHCCYAPI